jgi:small subunit ribosomal protein S16
MLKIRLRRMGAIKQPSYRIVVADSRSPRDGRFVDVVGHYNPLTDPATIRIDITKYEDWKRKGAQPTQAVVSLVRRFKRMQGQAEAEQVQAKPADRRTRAAKAGAEVATADAVEAPAPTAEAGATTPEAVEQNVTES